MEGGREGGREGVTVLFLLKSSQICLLTWINYFLQTLNH